MIPDSMMFRAAWSSTAAGVVLVVANWYTKPEAALAWIAALAMFAVMAVALRMSRRGGRGRSTDASATPRSNKIPAAVVVAAIMMGIPLALTLARSYGIVDDIDFGRRLSGVLIGAFLMMLGNVMPRNLPPLSSTKGDGARQQAFYRRAGWTWVLCGLASAVGWLALPVGFAEVVTIALVLIAMAVTFVPLLRLRRPHPFTP